MLSEVQDNQTKHLTFSPSIKQNLTTICSDLQNSLKKVNYLELATSSLSNSSVSNFDSEQQKHLRQNLKLLKQLFINWQKNEAKSILIYNKLIIKCKQITYNRNPIFSNTIFHSNIWPLMTWYLESSLKYNKLRTDNSKIVDVWYQYFATKEKAIFDKVLCNNLLKTSNLGQWFRNQCLESLCQNFYIEDKNGCTNFFVNFFLYGLAFLFVESVDFLKRSYYDEVREVPQQSKQDKIAKIQHIQNHYIKKFKLLQIQ